MESDPGRGVYKICGKFWNVGTRYKLHEHIGAGSYGDVCRATDCQASIIVALKRVGDVLCCPLLAKRVLREVCIMRRLSHPYVITLTDVFTSMSMDVTGGIDLYIATEFADGGDMYHLRQPLSGQDVKFLMWQLLTGMSYIHSCRVWHRDVKSENILLMSDMSVKICDFGLSRSAEETASAGDLEAKITSGRVLNGRKSLTRQYTKMVVTPSYRAPEVIMSRGQYSSSIDIWSLGCIFWELLIRSINPNMTGPPLRPLFGVREEPVTPLQGQSYTDDRNSPLHEQLDVIFDVVGTPGWNDIESVPSESWRSYLKHLPGRAGNLTRQLSGFIDQEALDLLHRMLAFNPVRRCTAEEALSHIYFKGLERPNGFVQGSFEAAAPGESVWRIKDPAIALDILERELEASVYERDGGRQKLEWLLQQEIEQQKQQDFFRHSLLVSMQYLRQNAALLNNPNMLEQRLTQNGAVQQNGMVPAPAAAAAAVQQFLVKKKATIAQQQKIIRPDGFPAGDSFMNAPYRITRSAAAAAAAAAAAQAAAANCVVKVPAAAVIAERDLLQTVGSETAVAAAGVAQPGLPRRSPRLKDLQAGELPHRKRLCLQPG